MKIKKILFAFLLSLSLSNYNSIEPCGLERLGLKINNYFKDINKKNKIKKELQKNKKIWKQTGLLNSISWFAKQNEETISIHESAHLVVAKILDSHVKRIFLDGDMGHIRYIIKHNNTNSICIHLAGYLAEKIVFNKAANGCIEDINKATKEIVELHELDPQDIETIKEKIQKYLNRTEEIILQNLDIIKQFATILIDREYTEILIDADGDKIPDTEEHSAEKHNKTIRGKIIFEKEINQIYEDLTQAAR